MALKTTLIFLISLPVINFILYASSIALTIPFSAETDTVKVDPVSLQFYTVFVVIFYMAAALYALSAVRTIFALSSESRTLKFTAIRIFTFTGIFLLICISIISSAILIESGIKANVLIIVCNFVMSGVLPLHLMLFLKPAQSLIAGIQVEHQRGR